VLEYDYLIVATGATHSYFGRDDWATAAPGLKSVEDALEIRRRSSSPTEAAEREGDPVAQREWLTFAVVGAGPTGVELAGAMGEIGLQTLAHDFRTIDPTGSACCCSRAAIRILGTYPPSCRPRHSARSSAAASRSASIPGSPRSMPVASPSRPTATRNGFDARTVVWAAGVRASSLAPRSAPRAIPSGRVEVLSDLSIPGIPRCS